MSINKLDFSSLVVEWSTDNEHIKISFKGDIDETFRGEAIPLPKARQYTIDASRINNFNSCGIREWTLFVNTLNKNGSIVFEKCSVNFIDQVNMVPESLGNGHILSFNAPYYCATHGEIDILLDEHHIAQIKNTTVAPQISCEKCKQYLEFDALEESFFLFLKTEEDLSNAS